jgi:hypothetical protein
VSHDFYAIGIQESAISDKDLACRLKNILWDIHQQDFYTVISSSSMSDRCSLCFVSTCRLIVSSSSSRISSAYIKLSCGRMNNVCYIYTQVLSENLWGMRLVVLGKPEYRDMISHVQTGTVRTGIANTLGM